MRRSMPMSWRQKFAALADDIAKATGQPRTPRQVAEGSCRSPSPTWRMRSSRSRCRRATTPHASRCNASAAPAVSTPAWSPMPSAWRPCSSIRLPACCRPMAWVLLTRRSCANRLWKSRSSRTPWRNCASLPTDWRTRRRRRLPRRAPIPRASSAHRTLHLRYAGTEAALIVPLRSEQEIVADFTAAHRARFGFATEDRELVVEAVAVEANAPGDAVQEATLPARASGGAARGGHDPDLHRRQGSHRAGVRSHRSARGRPHRRTRPDPRSQRHHGGGAGLDGRDHRARSHDAAPHRTARDPRVRPTAAGPIRCCSSCSTTCS